jgi:hypothetical protein
MKHVLKCSRRNRSWLALGCAIALGIVATGLNPKLPHEHLTQLAAQVRAAYRLVSVVAAKKELARSARLPYAFGHIGSRIHRQHAVSHYSAMVASSTIAASNTHCTTTKKTGAAP